MAQVNEILYEDWAPIGFVGLLPKDEYEQYAARVASLLLDRCTEERLASYLSEAEAAVVGSAAPVTCPGLVSRLLALAHHAD